MKPQKQASTPQIGIRANHTKNKQLSIKTLAKIKKEELDEENKRIVKKKIKKIRNKLNNLYPEYEYLNTTKKNDERLSELIVEISRLEYKYIGYLKSKYNIKAIIK